MQCHVCGTEVLPEHKFCMECGARLHRRTAVTNASPDEGATNRLPALPAPADHPMFDPVTGELVAVPPPPPPPLPPPDDDATKVLPAIGEPVNKLGRGGFGPPDVSAQGPGQWDHQPSGPVWPAEPYHAPSGPPAVVQQPRYRTDDDVASYAPTGRVPATYTPWEVAPWEGDQVVRAPSAFRLRPLLFLTILAAAAAVVAMFVRLLDEEPGEPWKLNDFGTNLTVAGILTALTMVLGALAWCQGFRWGAGLAGGAGAGLAGWAILVLGQAEIPLSAATGAEVTRDVGYWALAGAGGLGIVVMFVSLVRASDDGRAGLDPWVAALGAMATIAAVAGPLWPLNDAGLEHNWSSPAGADLPTLFFVSRAAQLGLLLFCGVFGFLMVRRYGLGLAIGGTIGAGWLVLTTATEQTAGPVGLAVTNPGAPPDFVTAAGITAGKPFIVTIIGVGLMLFFGLVATAMALIDDR